MKNIEIHAEMRQLIKEAAESLERLERCSIEKEAEDLQNRKTTGRATLANSILVSSACSTAEFQKAKKLLRALDDIFDEQASS